MAGSASGLNQQSDMPQNKIRAVRLGELREACGGGHAPSDGLVGSRWASGSHYSLSAQVVTDLLPFLPANLPITALPTEVGRIKRDVEVRDGALEDCNRDKARLQAELDAALRQLAAARDEVARWDCAL